jgi:hypothetical protein
VFQDKLILVLIKIVPININSNLSAKAVLMNVTAKSYRLQNSCMILAVFLATIDGIYKR